MYTKKHQNETISKSLNFIQKNAGNQQMLRQLAHHSSQEPDIYQMDWGSRTLKRERKAINNENERLRAEWSIQEAESEFDDELAEAYDRYSRQEFYTQTLHHKLPQREIRDYINELTQEEKKDLLLHFLRYDPEKPDSNDVTSEEYSQILSGTDHELIDFF